MLSYSKHDVILVRYPFSALLNSKVRPAVVVSAACVSQDILITPLTSKTGALLGGGICSDATRCKRRLSLVTLM